MVNRNFLESISDNLGFSIHLFQVKDTYQLINNYVGIFSLHQGDSKGATEFCSKNQIVCGAYFGQKYEFLGLSGAPLYSLLS